MAETTLDRGAAEAIAGGWHCDPFGVLGPHKAGKGWEIRAFVPGAGAAGATANRSRMSSRISSISWSLI